MMDDKGGEEHGLKLASRLYLLVVWVGRFNRPLVAVKPALRTWICNNVKIYICGLEKNL